MSALEVFAYEGANVRVVEIDGEPWFVLADLARVLDIAAPGRLAARLDEGMRQAHTLQTAGGPQQMAIVSEAGMYEVVIRSDKPEAAQFRRWITTEVLPAIRRTGTYTTAPTHTLPASYAEALRELAATVETTERLTAELAIAAPRAEAFAHFLDGDRDYSVGDAAKMLTGEGVITGERRLFTWLSDRRWTFRREGHWHLMQTAVDAGYGRMKPSSATFVRSDGTIGNGAPQVRITGKGLDRLLVALRTERAQVTA